MKKLLTTLLFGSIFSACAERQPVPAIPSDPEIEGKIEKLLKGMTLEEKIGQMCELTIGILLKFLIVLICIFMIFMRRSPVR